jgi:putative transposase
MPWNEASPMDQRTDFIKDVLRHSLSITELCLRYNISRRTGYKWIERHQQEGLPGLRDRSRKPRTCPHRTDDGTVALIVEARMRHPTWGAKKLRKILSKRHPDRVWPSRSTMCDILDRNELIDHRRTRRNVGHPGKPTAPMDEPNKVVCADFKGQFKTGDGIYCYPLTVTDGCSRYLLGCRGLFTTKCRDAKPVFRRLFQEYGLPDRIRTDNGVPFATNTLARLSSLSAWWVRLGIMPDLIEPGKPQQNGRHERMHRTLKAETARPPASSMRAQQRRFDRFMDEYNNDRPHEALNQETPASVYRPSHRTMPTKVPPLEYPAHYETRYVSSNGGMRWNNRWVNVSTCCVDEYVGLEEIDDGVWDVYFGRLKLGRLLEEHSRIEDQFGRLRRHEVLPMYPD